jgi:flagellin-like protein
LKAADGHVEAEGADRPELNHMKANQKFRSRDDAVSPVIAVILMVAITVVLAATVYVWVSGFGSNSSQPAKSIAFTSGGTLQTALDLNTGASDAATDDSYKVYIVSAASPGLKYSDLVYTLNGVTATHSNGDCDNVAGGGEIDDLLNSATAGTVNWLACGAALGGNNVAAKSTDALVTAGDHIYIMFEGSSMAGQTFRVLDSAANSIIMTLVVS